MATSWFVISGALLSGFALAGTELKRLPVTPSMFYLAAGAWLGPWGGALLHVDALDDTAMLERRTEIAVIISLFTAGLKLRLPLGDRRWRVAVLLAGVAMVLTIAGIAAFGLAIGGRIQHETSEFSGGHEVTALARDLSALHRRPQGGDMG